MLWEVGAQGLVIAQRPLPGLAHAFVFWGFCVFALVTLNHFAAGFGHPFLSRSGFWGSLYFFIAGLFAIAVAISIAGLAFRRFVIRPKWLEPLSPESGLIAFLIFALMVTYLATFWVPEGNAAGWALWWAHTLVIWFFLPLIPTTKHMHLVLSPLTIFLERAGFSQIPPLVGDEDFGLVAGKDLTQIDALQAYSCVECGRCTEHCPANNTGKILNPKEIILGTRHYLNEFGPKSEELLLGKHLSTEAVFECTTCGACEFQCPVGIQHLPIIVGLRRGAVNTGKWENSHGSELFVTLERQGNALGFPPSDREKFIEKNGLPYFDGSQEYCLWMGCLGSFDPNGRKILLALVEVLNHLGITFRRSASGKVQWRSGAAAGQRLFVRRAGAGKSGADSRGWSEENGFHLSPLRAHDRRGLEGTRRQRRHRAPQRVAGPFSGQAAAGRRESRRAWCFTTRVIWEDIAACMTSRAR